jgi:hypothetical protein
MLISNAGFFQQDHLPLRVEMITGNVPVVYVSPTANAKMQHYVDIVDDEVGWLGTVEELECGDYYIDDVYLFDQEVNGATTEISEDSLAKFADEKLKADGGMELMNKMRFWGHSHVNMATGASGQDNAMMDTFSTSGHDFFIRGIFNKKGEVNLSVYHYGRGIIFHHVEWQIYTEETDELREEIEAEVKQKVKKKTYSYSSAQYPRYQGNYPRSSYPPYGGKQDRLPLSTRYPQGGSYSPSNPDSWSLPAREDAWNYSLEEDVDLAEDEREYLIEREKLLKGTLEDDETVAIDDLDDIDPNSPEMTEEEYEDLVQGFHRDIANEDVQKGRIPDDPQSYKYRGKKK